MDVVPMWPPGRARGQERVRSSTGSGFTLLEVLITALLVSVGMAWMLQANVTSLRLAAQSHTALLAVKGVQEYYAEYLRSLPYDQLVLTPGPLPSLQAPALQDLPGGSAQYQVELVDGNPSLKRVTITVAWTNPDGRAQTSTFSTVIGCQGLTDASTAPCP